MLSSESLDVSSSVFLSSSSETKSSYQSPFEMLSNVSSKPFLVRYSDISSKSSVWLAGSHRSSRYLSILGSGVEDEYGVKLLYSEHWPPDFWVKS